MTPIEQQSPGGVSGTVSAYNFIRRIGFPKTADIITIFITLAGFAVILGLPLSGLSLPSTLLIATLTIVFPSLLGELMSSSLFLQQEPVLNFRRLMGMETLSWLPLLVLLPLYSLAGTLTGSQGLWIDGLFVCVAVGLPVRFLTIFSMSRLGTVRKLAAAITVPVLVVLAYALCLDPSTSVANILNTGMSNRTGLGLAGSALLLIAGLFSWIAVNRIIGSVDRLGSDVIGDAPMELFRDFLRHWLKGEGRPLESRLAALGRTGRVDVSTLAFQGADGLKAGVIISSFHPGPYRDLGSGGLPSMLKFGVEKTTGSVVMVPHGISNHEYNIISREDVLRLIDEASLKFPAKNDRTGSSVLVRETYGDAKATAQIFGDTAFLTLTLAPADMEDIPTQVREELEATGRSEGLNVLIADAHNSLKTQVSLTESQATMLREAGAKALARASQLPRLTFSFGAASDPVSEFNIEEGIGPGGVSVLTIESQGQRIAYVTIDGNNMQHGYRQALLESIHAEGFDEGEVMTTDTHLVAGVRRSSLGYYPVGQGVDREVFTAKVRGVVKAAMSRMSPGTTGFSTFSLDVRVLGSASFQSITSFVGRIARRIGRSFLRLELVVLVLSIAIMLVM